MACTEFHSDRLLGHIYLDQVVEAMKDGVRVTGAVSLAFNTIVSCNGICQGPEMYAAVPGRDVTKIGTPDRVPETHQAPSRWVTFQWSKGSLFDDHHSFTDAQVGHFSVIKRITFGLTNIEARPVRPRPE